MQDQEKNRQRLGIQPAETQDFLPPSMLDGSRLTRDSRECKPDRLECTSKEATEYFFLHHCEPRCCGGARGSGCITFADVVINFLPPKFWSRNFFFLHIPGLIDFFHPFPVINLVRKEGKK